jgi:hypothetical protein
MLPGPHGLQDGVEVVAARTQDHSVGLDGVTVIPFADPTKLPPEHPGPPLPGPLSSYKYETAEGHLSIWANCFHWFQNKIVTEGTSWVKMILSFLCHCSL